MLQKAAESGAWGSCRKRAQRLYPPFFLQFSCMKLTESWQPKWKLCWNTLTKGTVFTHSKSISDSCAKYSMDFNEKMGGVCKRQCFCGESIICNQETIIWHNVNHKSKIISLVRTLNLENCMLTPWFINCGYKATNCQEHLQHICVQNFRSGKDVRNAFFQWKFVFLQLPQLAEQIGKSSSHTKSQSNLVAEPRQSLPSSLSIHRHGY